MKPARQLPIPSRFPPQLESERENGRGNRLSSQDYSCAGDLCKITSLLSSRRPETFNEKIAKDKKVIPDPIDDRKFHE